jgi:hypothetical protein
LPAMLVGLPRSHRDDGLKVLNQRLMPFPANDATSYSTLMGCLLTHQQRRQGLLLMLLPVTAESDGAAVPFVMQLLEFSSMSSHFHPPKNQ